MAKTSSFLIFLFIFASSEISSTLVDNTLVKNAGGIHVTEAVIMKIKRSAIFGEDFNLLHRLAYVRTKFSPTPIDALGGIWALQEGVFTKAVGNTPTELRASINLKFGIQLNETVYSDCSVPLISGLTAALVVLQNQNGSLLHTMKDQAEFLFENKMIPNTTDFVNKVEELETGIICRTPFDLTLVIGGTARDSSTYQETVQLEKEFTKGLFGSFQKSDSTARLGLIAVRDNTVVERFPLNNPYNAFEIQQLIESTGFSSSSPNVTHINEGIKAGIDMVNGTDRRPSLPNIFVVLSNRESSEDGGVSNIAFARQLNLRTYAISISLPDSPISPRHEEELKNIGGNSPNRVWRTDADGLPELFRSFSREICPIQRIIARNIIVTGTLGPNEKRYHSFGTNDNYEYQLYLRSTSPNLIAYLSYTEEYTSSAIYDLTLPVPGVHFLPHAPSNTTRTYITIQNGQTTNATVNFSIVLDYKARTTTTTTKIPQTTTTTKIPTTTTTTTTTSTTPKSSVNKLWPTPIWALITFILYSAIYVTM